MNRDALDSGRSFLSYPLILMVDGQDHLLNDKEVDSKEMKNLLDIAKKKGDFTIAFYSSQPPAIFERIHAFGDILINQVSEKVDPILRELIKNAEKENSTQIARRAKLISNSALMAPLDLLGRILNEKEFLPGSRIPLLYQYPEMTVSVHVKTTRSHIEYEIENSGEISADMTELIKRRIELGVTIARFDLQQEFEHKGYEQVRDRISALFALAYEEGELHRLWKATFDEDYETYWNECPYFMLMQSGVHSSFLPYFAATHSQLIQSARKEENPRLVHFSAGMGYIQSAFILEANRNTYGTYGTLSAPFARAGRTVAGFQIGLPDVCIDLEQAR